jgi:hypothetical protein
VLEAMRAHGGCVHFYLNGIRRCCRHTNTRVL